MSKLSIAIKYSIPLLIVGISMLLIVMINAVVIGSMEDSTDTFPKEFMPAVSVVINADRDLYQARLAETSYVHVVKSTGRDAFKKDFEENAKQALDRFHEYLRYMHRYPNIEQQFNRFESQYNAWLKAARQSFVLFDQNQPDAAQAQSDGTSAQEFAKLREFYDQAGELAFNMANNKSDSIKADNDQQQWLNWLIVIVILLVAGGVSYVSQRALISRIRELTTRIDQIAKGGGDLTSKIQVTHEDELGVLAHAFNHFIENLRHLISGIREDVQQLDSTSQSLNQSSDSANKAIRQQSESTSLIVTAVEQMSSATRELSMIAQQTASETHNAIHSARSGMDKNKQSVSQVEAVYTSIEGASNSAKRLSASSTEISNVLDVIRGIAEQTNLLALNAAIEAARAGEQGRGFAVVADEVRALASKTQESTENIQSMIEGLQKGVNDVVSTIEEGFNKVSSSVSLSRETAQLLSEMHSMLAKVNDMSMQTAAATEEQSSVAEEINGNLNSLSAQTHSVQHSAAEAGQLAATLRQLAASIQKGIGTFRT